MKAKAIRRWRRRAIKKFKPNLTYLRDYERHMILGDIHALASIEVERYTVSRLIDLRPGRYDERYLAKALVRLAAERHLVKGKKERIGFSKRQTVYRLPDPGANRKAA